MKSILSHFIDDLFAISAVLLINSGFKIEGGWFTILYAAFLLTAINMLVKPLLKIMFLPINLITLGFFSWVINIIALFILTKFVPQIHIGTWNFPGLHSQLIAIPSFTLSPLINFIAVSVMLSFIVRILHWVHHKH